MKFPLTFIRLKPRARKTRPVELLSNWTVRDWADLPVHHPRRD